MQLNLSHEEFEEFIQNYRAGQELARRDRALAIAFELLANFTLCKGNTEVDYRCSGCILEGTHGPGDLREGKLPYDEARLLCRAPRKYSK